MKSKVWLWLVCIPSLLLNAYLIYYFIYHLPTESAQSVLDLQQTSSAGAQALASKNQPAMPLTAPVSEPNKSETSAYQTTNATVKATKNDTQPPQSENRAELLAQATTLLHEEQYPELRLFLHDYLQQQPLDMDFLLLEAQLNVKTELLSDAIAHYYSLTRLPMSAAQSQEISDNISQLSSQTISQLQRAYSWDTLAIFVEPLLQLEPQNRSYILALAEAYAQQSQFNLMENILASLDFDDPAAQRIRQLASVANANIENPEQNNEQDSNEQFTNASIAVNLQQIGDQYIVNAQLAGNSVALLIDTGASMTAISMQYFRNLKRSNMQYLGRFSVNTASGQVLAPMYQFSELKLNHAVVQNISVVLLPMRNMDNVNGLLGMNFLREFDFKIDQRQSQLLLKR